MTLVHTRQKLQPFVDEGVVHKDRKRIAKKEKLVNEYKKTKIMDATLQIEAREYR